MTTCFLNPQDGDAESVTLNLKGTSVTGTWDPASRAFELTGPDTVDAYRAILASARYVNTGKLFTIDTQRPPTKELGFTAGARQVYFILFTFLFLFLFLFPHGQIV